MSDDASVLERIQLIGQRLEAIQTLASDGRRAEATAAFRALKMHLEDEYDRMKTIRGEASLSESERAFYQPFITDVFVNSGMTSVRWDSHPNKWKDALWGASDYVSYYTHSLKRTSESEK